MGTNITSGEGCYDFSTSLQVSTNNACLAPDPDPIPEDGCVTPRNIRVQQIGTASFIVRWDRPTGDFRGYEWEVGYRDEPGTFVTQRSFSNRVKIHSPWPKPILFRVRTKCSWNEFSDYSDFIELEVAANEEEDDEGAPSKTGGKSLTDSSTQTDQVATPRNGGQGIQLGELTVIEESISIYPNPTSDYANISYSSWTDSAIVELYNYQGQRIRQIHVTNNQTQRVDLSGVPGGIYMVTLRSDGEIVTSERLLVTDR